MKGVNDRDLTHTKVHMEGAVALITLNRPEKLNAFTVRMHKELIHLFDCASRDDNVRSVVVTGNQTEEDRNNENRCR